jgi:hypothetical protein
MNAVHMMASQGGVALGGISWGWSASSFGLGETLVGGAILLAISLMVAVPLSINFAQSLDLDPAPLEAWHDFPSAPEPMEGPVTITVEYVIRPKQRDEFLSLMEQVRLIFLRNGAFLFRVQENLENPGTFWSEMLVSTWAEQYATAWTHDEGGTRDCSASVGNACWWRTANRAPLR